MRWLLIAVLAAVVSGCGAAAPPKRIESPPPDYGQPLGSAAESSRAQQPLWAVRAFDEKPQWLSAHPALAKGEPNAWAVEMQLAVTNALDAKGAGARALPAGVTDEQLKKLFADGLNYLVEGTMTAVAADAQKNVTLKVGYRLKRRLGNDTRLVQARSMTASVPSAAVDEAAMRALIPLVAAKIADAVVADVPADLLAVRG